MIFSYTFKPSIDLFPENESNYNLIENNRLFDEYYSLQQLKQQLQQRYDTETTNNYMNSIHTLLLNSEHKIFGCIKNIVSVFSQQNIPVINYEFEYNRNTFQFNVEYPDCNIDVQDVMETIKYHFVNNCDSLIIGNLMFNIDNANELNANVILMLNLTRLTYN